MGICLVGSACATTPPLSPPELLAKAVQRLDVTPTLHFVLSGSNLPKKGSVLISGEGDLERPASIKGQFQILFSGLPVAASVVGIGNNFYALLPFATKYTRVSPSELGFGNPAGLLNKTAGLAGLLTRATDLSPVSEVRNNGQLIDKVTVTLPGPPVAALLTSAAPQDPFQATVEVNPGTDQIVQISLTGHFYSATSDSTYTVVLSRYGEKIQIAAPGT
jgi:hypothetical protein